MDRLLVKERRLAKGGEDGEDEEGENRLVEWD